MRILSGMTVFFLFFTITHAPSLVSANLISYAAGQAGDEIVTSREVVLHAAIENILSGRKPQIILKPSMTTTPEFTRELMAALLEVAVNFEVESIGSGSIDMAEAKKNQRQVEGQLRKDARFKKLEFDAREIEKVVLRKLRARQFIRFKMDSSQIPISDREAQEYFARNKLKFDGPDFENFKQNIKSYLASQQVDRRLKDWFDLLQSRYKIRSLLVDE